MSNIGTLSVSLVANSEKFSRGINKARKDMTLFDRGASALKSRLVGLGSVLAAGLVAKVSIQGLKQAADEMDRLAKQADTLKLSTESLDGFGRAAEVAGSNSEAMVKALGFMERSLNKGSDAFGRLGLDINQLRRLRPETVFLEIADAIRKVEDAGMRLQIVKDIFGKGGEGIVPTLLGGSEGIRREMAMQSGFSRADAQSIEEANDAMTRLGHTVDSLERTMAIKFAPALERIIGGINSALGGPSSPEDVGIWSKKLNALSDAQFAKFGTAFLATNKAGGEVQPLFNTSEQNFSGKRADAELAAISQFLGEDAAKLIAGTGSHDLGSRMAADAELNNLRAAMRERDMRMTQEMEKRRERDSFLGPPGMHGGPLGFGLMGMGAEMGMSMAMSGAIDSLMQKMERARDQGLGPAGLHRIDAGVANMLADDKHKVARASSMDATVNSNAALQEGTASAFTQERRSQQAAQMLDTSKQQLKETKEQTKALQRIDTNLKSALTASEAANLA